MKITTLQKKIDHYIKTYGVRYFSELTNMVVLTEEVGELARHISRKYGEQSYKEEISDNDIKEKIAEEVGDIIFVTFCLANQMGIDLTKVMKDNIKKKKNRDSKRHYLNEKLIILEK